MSVINQMLNDVEKRQGEEPETQETKPEVAFLESKPDNSRKKAYVIAIVRLVVLVGLMVGAGFYMYSTGVLSQYEQLLGDKPQTPATTSSPEVEPMAATPQSVAAGEQAQTQAETQQPELIVIPQQTVDGKPVERQSTLSISQGSDEQTQTLKPVQTASGETVDGAEKAQPDTEAVAKVSRDDSAEPQAIISPASEPPPKPKSADGDGKVAIKKVSLTPEQRADKFFANGKKATGEGKVNQAIEQYRKALNLLPGHQQARMELAALYYGREMIHEALQVLGQGLAHHPDNVDWSLLAAKIHYKRNNFGAALGFLQLPVGAKENTEYVALKATLLQKIKAYEQSVLAYRQLTEAFQYNGRWWLGLATALEGAGQPEEAVKAYQQARNLGNISNTSLQFVQSRLQLLDR